jgi:hypothetical protein
VEIPKESPKGRGLSPQVVRKEVERMVEVVENGKKRRVSVQDAAIADSSMRRLAGAT